MQHPGMSSPSNQVISLRPSSLREEDNDVSGAEAQSQTHRDENELGEETVHTGQEQLGSGSHKEENGNEEQQQSLSKSKRRRKRRQFLNSKFNPMLVLENSGSVARDHLASERTFLAYTRTSLVIASTGVALVQLFTISLDASKQGSITLTPASRRVQSFAKPLGITTILFSIVVLAIGVVRYFTIQHALILGKFPVARMVILITALALVVIIIIVFAVLAAGGGVA